MVTLGTTIFNIKIFFLLLTVHFSVFTVLKQDKPSTYIEGFRKKILAVEKQKVLHSLSVCL
jgi:hypothetical protein